MKNIIYIHKANIKAVRERSDRPIYYDIKSATVDGKVHGYTMQVSNCTCRPEVHMEDERPRFYTSVQIDGGILEFVNCKS